MKKTLLSLSVISGLLISSNSHAQLSWGENITAGSTTLKASHINEIRDAIEDLRTDVDAGSGGVWTSGAGGDVYYNGGDVGIGTNAPESEFHLKDASWTTLKIEATTAGTDPVVELINNATGAAAWSMRLDESNADVLQWRYNNSARVTVETNGNVGIGTSSPGDRLEVNSGGADNVANFVSSNPTAYIRLTVNNDLAQRIEWANRNGRTAFWNPNSSDALNIVHASGNVGIGTTAPSQKLDVAGSAEINGTVFSNDLYAINNTRHKYISGGNGGNNGANILMYGGSHATTGVRADMNFRTNSSTRMHINGANGNIGIGTTSPSSKLDVNGEITLQNRLTMQPAAASYIEATRVGTTDMINVVSNDSIQLSTGSNVPRLRINGNGNVGIGTVTPTAKLELAQADGSALKIGIDGEVDGSIQFFDDDAESSQNFKITYNAGSQDLRFDSGVTNNVLYLDHDGNVGIGNSSPSAKLQINGDVRFEGGGSNTLKFIDNDDDNFIIHQNSGGLYFMNDNNNNETWDDGNDDRIVMRGQANGMYMGIGTNSPSQELDVIGNIRATGQVRATSYCDTNGANCASNPFMNPISVNGNEDVYGAFTAGAPVDTCNGDNTNPYTCGASTNQNCVDRVSGTTSYSCGKNGLNTCNTTNNQRRDINCQHLQVYGNLTP